MTKPIPEGFTTVTPCLSIEGADKAVELYKKAFGATVDDQLQCPETGKLMHATLTIGDAKIMLGETMPDCPMGSTKSSICLYVPDADASFKKATQAGMKSAMEPEDMFWGDRMGSVMDPSGNSWSVATHQKDMSQGEIEKAAKDWMQKMKQQKKAA